MITINGQKMGKSLGNFITLPQLFAGDHPKLAQAYSPMTIRFFILQAHYRGTLDFSNEALQAAEKGLKRILQAYKDLVKLAGAKPLALEYGEYINAVAPDHAPEGLSAEVAELFENVYKALCDDLNTPVALAHLFDAVRIINSAKEGKAKLAQADLQALGQRPRRPRIGRRAMRSGMPWALWASLSRIPRTVPNGPWNKSFRLTP